MNKSIILLALVMLVGCGSPSEQGKATSEKAVISENQQKALEHFKTQEKQVKDAMWSKGILKLGVLDDGSNRNGFAEYACQILKDDYKITEPTIVEVLDIAKLSSTNKEVMLGKATCK